MYLPFFEYSYEGELTPLLEEKTKILLNTYGSELVPFNLIKYYDEKIYNSDKKRRTIILTSYINLSDYFYNTYFKDCNLDVIIYYKQQIT